MKRAAFAPITLFFFLLSWVTVSFAQDANNAVSKTIVTLADLDKIVSEVPDLETFLKRPDLIDTYFNALAIYYDTPNFQRESFDGIIKQLQALVKKVPKLKERLWQETNLGSAYQVATTIKISGRELNEGEWFKYQSQWLEKIEKAEGSLKLASLSQQEESILKVIQDFNKAKAEHEVGLQGLKKKEAEIQTGLFLKKQREKVEFKEVAAVLLGRYLKSGRGQDILNTGDADLLLEAFEQLKNKTLEALQLPEKISLLPGPLLTEIRSMVPAQSDLLNMKKVFEIKTRNSHSGQRVAVGGSGIRTYHFEPLPRRIHGLWKGMSILECVGGGDVSELTPERWATVALKDTQLFHVRSGYSYLGFIQVVPIKNKDTGKIYGSVDFGASFLNNKAITYQEKSGRYITGTVFDLWLPEAKRHLPKGWAGYVVGSSQAINNAGVLDTVQRSGSYTLGPVVGKRKDFKFGGMAKDIVKNANAPKYSEYPAHYGGKMIFDAMVKGSGDLHRLIELDPDLLNNERKIAPALAVGTKEYQGYILKALAQRHNNFQNPEILKAIANLVFSDSPFKKDAAQIILTHQDVSEEIRALKLKVFLNVDVSSEQRTYFIRTMTSQKNFLPEVTNNIVLNFFKYNNDSLQTATRDYLDRVVLTPQQARHIIEYANLKDLSDAWLVLLADQHGFSDSEKKELFHRALQMPVPDEIFEKFIKLYFQLEPNLELRKEALEYQMYRGVVTSGGRLRETLTDPKILAGVLKEYFSVDVRQELLLSLPRAGHEAGDMYVLDLALALGLDVAQWEALLVKQTHIFRSEGAVDRFMGTVANPSDFRKIVYLAYISHPRKEERFATEFLRNLTSNSAADQKYVNELIRWSIENSDRHHLPHDRALEMFRVRELQNHLHAAGIMGGTCGRVFL